MRLRFATSALVFLVVLTMATGAFAQSALFTVGSGTEPRGRMNGYAEAAGSVTLFVTNGTLAVTDTGTVLIDYGVPVANGVDPTDDANGITVNICGTEVPMDNADTDNNEAEDVAVDDNTITISVEENCGAGESISVSGVLLSLVGSGTSSVVATVTTTGALGLPGGTANRVTVIENVVDPLEDDNVDVGQKMTLTRHTGEPSDAQFHLVITEPHVDSFDGAQLELKFSGIPEDVSVVDLDAWVTTKSDFDNDETMTAVATKQIPVGSPTMRVDDVDDEGEATVYLQGDMLPGIDRSDPPNNDFDDDGDTMPGGGMLTSMVDVVVIRGSIDGADEEDLLPIDLNIQVAVDLGPIGDEDDVADDGPPVFDSDRTTPMTVIDSTSAQTKLTVPFAVDNGTYDTGIAVSNMTEDQTGGVTVDFFVGGTMMSYTTEAGSPGTGLNANGMLEPGNTWSVLLSELFPGNLGVGYLIIMADFTGADGNTFVSDFLTFSSTGVVRLPPLPANN